MRIPSRRATSVAGLRSVRAVALLGTLVLVFGACGNESSKSDLKALLGNNNNPSASQPQASTGGAPAADSGAAAPAGDSGTAATPAPASTPGAPASPAAGTAAGGSASAAPRTAAGSAKSSAGAGGSSAGGPQAASAASAGPAPGTGGPSGVPGAPTPGGPKAPAPVGCTGNEPPIIIGTVGTMSGFVGYVFQGGARAVAAWAADMNDRGGLNCHKIKHLIGDSAGDPARYQALVRQFVERDGVQTFVFNPDSFAAQSAADYLDEKGIPVIGGGGGEMFTYDRAMQFPVYAMGVLMQTNEVFQASRVFIPKGLKKIGTAECVEAEYCPIFKNTVKEIGPKLGFDVVYQADIALTSPDYTSNCLEAKNRGVQAWITSLDGQTNHRLVNSCAKLGMKTPITAASLQGNADFKDNPNMEGSVIGMNTLPWFFNTDPQIAEYQRILTKYSKGTAFEPSSINGWTTAKAFEHAMRKINFAPSAAFSAKDTLAGLYALNGDNLDGLTYPLRFSPDQPKKKKIACGYPVVVGRGTFTSVPQSACMPGLEP
jgi:branched-chain amino acid transport system substrate-binding protein